MRVKGVRLCSSVVERLTCNQEVLSSILSGGTFLSAFFVDAGGSRAARPPAGARERARIARRGRREATRSRGDARDTSRRVFDDRVEPVCSVFDTVRKFSLCDFWVRCWRETSRDSTRGAPRARAPCTVP